MTIFVSLETVGVRFSLMQGTKPSCVELTAGLMPSAEKELAAYARAVQERFGSEHARQAVEDWMKELEAIDLSPGGAIPDWRRLTIAAASRLAIQAQHSKVQERGRILSITPPKKSTRCIWHGAR